MPLPPDNAVFYRDIAVLALPTPRSELTKMADAPPRLTASAHPGEVHLPVVLPVPEPGKPQYVQVEFPQPFTASTLEISQPNLHGLYGTALKVQISNDGREFTTIGDCATYHFPQIVQFNKASARYYRVLFTVSNKVKNVVVDGLELHNHYRIGDIENKTAVQTAFLPPDAAPPKLPAEFVTPQDGIVDLTTKMNKDGRLVWDAPPGQWTVLRFGHTTTGATNLPAPESGCGLECDKLSKEGIEAQFAGMMNKLARDCGVKPGEKTGLVATHIDSWENGSQNWTARMREEFQKRRGYDLLPYLPVMTGRVVDSLAVSERFLWDLRQTISDLVVENYAGQAEKLSRRQGLRLSIEAYGGPCDEITYAGRADEPMAEFWMTGLGPDNYLQCPKEMASAAHIYGRRIVGAESFTSGDSEKWRQYPASIKTLGDAAFCQGVNRFVFHRYAMQPWLNYRPGMTMGPWGLHYERTETWWEQSRPWHEYLARCQVLLRQGLLAADICHLRAENAEQNFQPHNRNGYDYDNCSAEAVFTRMSVQDGRIVLPDGMNYRLLAMPQCTTMTPALLRKIASLVEAGATIVGSRPLRSPSLCNYPKCDEEVKQLADQLWADCDGKAVKEHAFGKGKVVCGRSPEKVLAAMGIPPDFEYANPKGNLHLDFIHRAAGDADIYFVANQRDAFAEAECTFRVSGKTPELWRPDSGSIKKAPVYAEKDGRIAMPLSFDPAGSVFVVFRATTADADHLVAVKHLDIHPSGNRPAFDVTLAEDGKLQVCAWRSGVVQWQTASGKSRAIAVNDVPQPVKIEGPWKLRFPPNSGAPEQATLERLISWSKHADPGVKHFSGTATYYKTIDVPRALLGNDRRLDLDLGDVQVMAQVKLNAKDLGVLWKPPYRVEITDAVKAGENRLQVNVVNLWPNRMIGDELLPEDSDRNPDGTLKAWPKWVLEGKSSPTGRCTFTTWRLWKKDDALLESGLIGPVRILTAKTIQSEL